jgi:hypothetical protein
LPKVWLWNEFVLFNGPDAVWESTFCAVVNIQNCPFGMQQKFGHRVHCDETLMTDFDSVPNFRVTDLWRELLVKCFCGILHFKRHSALIIIYSGLIDLSMTFSFHPCSVYSKTVVGKASKNSFIKKIVSGGYFLA